MSDTMGNNPDFYIPTREEFCRGYEIYNEREKRGFVYFEALELVSEGWGNYQLMAKGIQRLIRSWNRFYSNFSFSDLVHCLENNIEILETYRNRDIINLSEDDDENVRELFKQMLKALRRERDGALSPVSVAKAFGILAPNFLPIWDSNIAFKYDCLYLSDMADMPYVRFCHKMKLMAENVKYFVPSQDDRALLKRIDEYNYSKYTMYWI